MPPAAAAPPPTQTPPVAPPPSDTPKGSFIDTFKAIRKSGEAKLPVDPPPPADPPAPPPTPPPADPPKKEEKKTTPPADDKVTDPPKKRKSFDPPEVDPPAAPPADPPGSTTDVNMGELRKRRDAAEARVKELENNLNMTKAQLAQVKALEKERDDLNSQLSQVAYERTPQYRAEFTDKFARINAKLKELAPEHASLLTSIVNDNSMSTRRAELDDVLQNMTTSQNGLVLSYLKDAADLHQVRTERLTKISEQRAQSELIAEANAKAAAEQAAAAFEDAFSRQTEVFSKGFGFLQLKDGDTEWNTQREQILQDARSYVTQQFAADDLAQIALWAASGPQLYAQVKQLMALTAKLTAQNKELSEAQPTLAGGAAPKPGTPPAGEDFKTAYFRIKSEGLQQGS